MNNELEDLISQLNNIRIEDENMVEKIDQITVKLDNIKNKKENAVDEVDDLLSKIKALKVRRYKKYPKGYFKPLTQEEQQEIEEEAFRLLKEHQFEKDILDAFEL